MQGLSGREEKIIVSVSLKPVSEKDRHSGLGVYQ